MHAPSPFQSHLGDLPAPAESVADGVMVAQQGGGLAVNRRAALLMILGIVVGILITLLVQRMMRKRQPG
jgi:hypothetical protein